MTILYITIDHTIDHGQQGRGRHGENRLGYFSLIFCNTCKKINFGYSYSCNNVLVCVGSGKTAAFLVPMFEKLKAHSTKVCVTVSEC